MRTVLEILEEMQPEINYLECNTLIDDGILDSYDIVSLVGELNDEYNITIPMWQLVPDNFNSVEAIEKLVRTLKDK